MENLKTFTLLMSSQDIKVHSMVTLIIVNMTYENDSFTFDLNEILLKVIGGNFLISSSMIEGAFKYQCIICTGISSVTRIDFGMAVGIVIALIIIVVAFIIFIFFLINKNRSKTSDKQSFNDIEMETNDNLSDVRDEGEFWDSVNNNCQADPLWTSGAAEPPQSMTDIFEFEETRTFLDGELI